MTATLGFPACVQPAHSSIPSKIRAITERPITDGLLLAKLRNWKADLPAGFCTPSRSRSTTVRELIGETPSLHTDSRNVFHNGIFDASCIGFRRGRQTK